MPHSPHRTSTCFDILQGGEVREWGEGGNVQGQASVWTGTDPSRLVQHLCFEGHIGWETRLEYSLGHHNSPVGAICILELERPITVERKLDSLIAWDYDEDPSLRGGTSLHRSLNFLKVAQDLAAEDGTTASRGESKQAL